MNELNNISEEFETLCSGYVLGALNNKDRVRFENLLAKATFKERMLLMEMREQVAHFSTLSENKHPSLKVRNNVLQHALEHPKSSSLKNIPLKSKKNEPDGVNYLNRFISIAAVILFITTAILGIYVLNLKERVKVQSNKISELADAVTQKEAQLSILDARDVQVINLIGQKVNPEGYGRVYWDPDKKQAFLQVSNLPAVPKNKDYQLWMIKDNKPISAGMFDVNGKKKTAYFQIHKLAAVNRASLNAFAITLEPKGGAPQPTGKIYLMGSPGK